MDRIIILGNGPSIKKLNFKVLKKEVVIGTNNIFLNKKFSKIKNSYFTIYDKRFFNPIKEPLKKFIKKFKGNIYIPHKYKKEITKIKKQKIIFDNKNLKIQKSFKKKFCNQKDLLGTVIIEMAIPLALYLKVKKIILYGCEFDYKLKNNQLSNKSYFYKSNLNQQFDHNQFTAKKWSEHQIRNFKKVNIFLKKNNIKLEDTTPGGKLFFLKKKNLNQTIKNF